MDVIETKTEEIKEMHKEICDFYGFDRKDELRTKPVEFFEMWSNFFRDVERELPK